MRVRRSASVPMAVTVRAVALLAAAVLVTGASFSPGLAAVVMAVLGIVTELLAMLVTMVTLVAVLELVAVLVLMLAAVTVLVPLGVGMTVTVPGLVRAGSLGGSPIHQDAEPCRADAAPVDSIRLHRDARQIERGHQRAQFGERQPGVEQGAEQHVSGRTGVAVDVQDARHEWFPAAGGRPRAAGAPPSRGRAPAVYKRPASLKL